MSAIRSTRSAPGSAPTRPASRAATAGSRSSPTWSCSASTCRQDALRRAELLAAGADLLLCIGSSLEVYPVAQLPLITLRHGGQIAIITQGPTPFDGHAAVRCSGDVVAELDAVLSALGMPAPEALT